jgi:hypothetical protein
MRRPRAGYTKIRAEHVRTRLYIRGPRAGYVTSVKRRAFIYEHASYRTSYTYAALVALPNTIFFNLD